MIPDKRFYLISCYFSSFLLPYGNGRQDDYACAFHSRLRLLYYNLITPVHLPSSVKFFSHFYGKSIPPTSIYITTKTRRKAWPQSTFLWVTAFIYSPIPTSTSLLLYQIISPILTRSTGLFYGEFLGECESCQLTA